MNTVPPNSRKTALKGRLWPLLPLLLATAFLASTGSELAAQPGGARHRDRIQEVDPATGARMLEALRLARLDGDFIFEFEMRHFPRRGSTILYRGSLFGTWNEIGPLTRVELEDAPAAGSLETDAPTGVRLLMQNGPERWIARYDAGSEAPKLLAGEALFEPLIPGFTYSAFDLQMPFLFWDDYEYEGAQRLRGRPAHLFLMKPPPSVQKAAPELQAIRIAVDEDYHALLRVDWINQDDAVEKSYRILNFKRVDGQWLVKSIDLVDETAREKTRLRILSAAVRQELDESNFRVEGLKQSPSYPRSVAFESL